MDSHCTARLVTGTPSLSFFLFQEWRQKAKAAIMMATAAVAGDMASDADTSFLKEMTHSSDYFPRNEVQKYKILYVKE